MKNLFYDHEEKAYIEAVYKGGRFIEPKTGRPIGLRDGVRARIAIPIDSVLNGEEKKRHQEIRKELFLKNGEKLEFYFRYGDGGKMYEFRVVLLEDLFLTQKGNQHSKLSFCRCVIFKPDSASAKDFEADSLNQVFMQASIKYRPGNKSHTCNVFKTFHYQGRPLEKIRNF